MNVGALLLMPLPLPLPLSSSQVQSAAQSVTTADHSELPENTGHNGAHGHDSHDAHGHGAEVDDAPAPKINLAYVALAVGAIAMVLNTAPGEQAMAAVTEMVRCCFMLSAQATSSLRTSARIHCNQYLTC
jgi:hypothetical protein